MVADGTPRRPVSGASNSDLAHANALVKGAIMQMDSPHFCRRHEPHNARPISSTLAAKLLMLMRAGIPGRRINNTQPGAQPRAEGEGRGDWLLARVSGQ